MKFQKTFTVEISDEQLIALVVESACDKSEAENMLKNKVKFFNDYLNNFGIYDLFDLDEYFDTSASSWEKID